MTAALNTVKFLPVALLSTPVQMIQQLGILLNFATLGPDCSRITISVRREKSPDKESPDKKRVLNIKNMASSGSDSPLQA